MATYTRKFNLNSHHTKWEIPTLIRQSTQGLQNNIHVAVLLSQAEFDYLVKLYKISVSLDSTINGFNDTQEI